MKVVYKTPGGMAGWDPCGKMATQAVISVGED